MTRVEPVGPVRAATPPSSIRGVIVFVVALGIMNVARSAVIPHRAHFALNVSFALIVAFVAVRFAGLNRAELGLERSTIGQGFRYGLGAFALVVIAAVLASIVPAGRDALDVPEARVAANELAWRVAVIIPIGTVVTEEVMFRGVLNGLLARVWNPTRALIGGAALFGLWHVFPAWRADGAGAALGTFVATAVAGMVFLWLRRRSESLVAPALAHLATNTVPLIVAWFLVH